MCIAVLTTPGRSLSKNIFTRCFQNNRDGVGFAWIDPYSKQVNIDKGWLHLPGALNKYENLVKQKGVLDNPMLIHFRAATVGRIDQDNCHPFKVKGGAMIHNGTFWRDTLSTKSDSRQLAEIMHNQLHFANLNKNKEQFQEAFGYNRVAFLFNEGKYIIFSEEYEGKSGKFGQWHDGIWYSNGGWKGQYGGYYGDDNGPAGSGATAIDGAVALEDLEKQDRDALKELDRIVWGNNTPVYNPRKAS